MTNSPPASSSGDLHNDRELATRINSQTFPDQSFSPVTQDTLQMEEPAAPRFLQSRAVGGAAASGTRAGLGLFPGLRRPRRLGHTCLSEWTLSHWELPLMQGNSDSKNIN